MYFYTVASLWNYYEFSNNKTQVHFWHKVKREEKNNINLYIMSEANMDVIDKTVMVLNDPTNDNEIQNYNK